MTEFVVLDKDYCGGQVVLNPAEISSIADETVMCRSQVRIRMRNGDAYVFEKYTAAKIYSMIEEGKWYGDG